MVSGLRTLFEQYDVLGAFWMNIKLTFFSAIGALLLGTLIAVLRVSPVAVLRSFGTAYVNTIRNTPLTLIIFFCVFGLYNTMGLRLAPSGSPTELADNAFRFGVLGLAIYTASFVAEALRSGVNTVPQGQAEAARAIGLSFLPTLRYIVLPQAFRGAITPLGNTLIALTKNSTVCATVGVAEAALMMRNMIEFNSSLLFLIFIVMAGGFVILTLPLGVLFTWLSKKLAVAR